MGEQRIEGLWKECADLFYENSEQVAYETLASLLPELNVQLQELTCLLAGLPDRAGDVMQQKVLADMQELITAYQCRDGLALADLLYYDISEEVKLLEEIKQGAVQ